MAGPLWDTVSKFGKNVTKYSRTSKYVDRAVKWGAIGGAVGGVSEWASGGSFFEGVKSGAFSGAVAGAGYTAIQAGLGKSGSINSKISSAAKNRASPTQRRTAWKANQASQATQQGRRLRRTNVASSVNTIYGNNARTLAAKRIFHHQ